MNAKLIVYLGVLFVGLTAVCDASPVAEKMDLKTKNGSNDPCPRGHDRLRLTNQFWMGSGISDACACYRLCDSDANCQAITFDGRWTDCYKYGDNYGSQGDADHMTTMFKFETCCHGGPGACCGEKTCCSETDLCQPSTGKCFPPSVEKAAVNEKEAKDTCIGQCAPCVGPKCHAGTCEQDCKAMGFADGSCTGVAKRNCCCS
jgi:hypothetical protein